MPKIAQRIDPAAEDAYWRENYAREPYYEESRPYEYYAVFYLVGYEGRARSPGRTFEEAEADLRAEYERRRTASGPTWDEGRHAVRAAWDRLDHIFPDSD